MAGLERHCAGRGGTEVVSDARVPPSKTPSPRGPSTRFLVLLVKHPSPAPRTNLDPLRDSTAPGVGAGLARVFIRLRKGWSRLISLRLSLSLSPLHPIQHLPPGVHPPFPLLPLAAGSGDWVGAQACPSGPKPLAQYTPPNLPDWREISACCISSPLGDRQPSLSPRGCL